MSVDKTKMRRGKTAGQRMKPKRKQYVKPNKRRRDRLIRGQRGGRR